MKHPHSKAERRYLSEKKKKQRERLRSVKQKGPHKDDEDISSEDQDNRTSD